MADVYELLKEARYFLDSYRVQGDEKAGLLSDRIAGLTGREKQAEPVAWTPWWQNWIETHATPNGLSLQWLEGVMGQAFDAGSDVAPPDSIPRDVHDRLIREARLEVLQPIRQLVGEQAEDFGLWFYVEHAPEAYLQQELRRLHAIIEMADKEQK